MNLYTYINHFGQKRIIEATELPFFYADGFTLFSVTRMTHEQETASVLETVQSAILSIT